MSTQTPTREMFLRPTAFEVASESKPDVTYRVQLPDCTCPDFKYRRTTSARDWACKHIKAAFSAAGWQLPTRDVSRLDEATAVELLIDLGISARAATAAVRRSWQPDGSVVELPDAAGSAIVVYNHAVGTYDVQLPA